MGDVRHLPEKPSTSSLIGPDETLYRLVDMTAETNIAIMDKLLAACQVKSSFLYHSERLVKLKSLANHVATEVGAVLPKGK